MLRPLTMSSNTKTPCSDPLPRPHKESMLRPSYHVNENCATQRLHAQTPLPCPATQRLHAQTPLPCPATQRLNAQTPYHVQQHKDSMLRPLTMSSNTKTPCSDPLPCPATQRLHALTPYHVHTKTPCSDPPTMSMKTVQHKDSMLRPHYHVPENCATHRLHAQTPLPRAWKLCNTKTPCSDSVTTSLKTVQHKDCMLRPPYHVPENCATHRLHAETPLPCPWKLYDTKTACSDPLTKSLKTVQHKDSMLRPLYHVPENCATQRLHAQTPLPCSWKLCNTKTPCSHPLTTSLKTVQH